MADTAGDPEVAAYFVPPVVVVQTMRGERVARSIPELGHAPCVRWKDEKSARFMVTTLLREILLGLFYRLISRGLAARDDGENLVFINRTPDPVMVDRILADLGSGARPAAFVHPGYGLSAMDRLCLAAAFPDLKFVSFSEISAKAATEIPPLGDRVIAVSAGNSPDILRGGAGDEHNQELLRRLLRPLFRAGASVLYGGSLPTGERPADPAAASVNFTETFLELLLSERDSAPGESPSTARLYNLSAWPHSESVTPRIRAQWTDICSFIPIGWERAELGKPPDPPALPAAADLDRLPPAKRTAALAKHAAAAAECLASRRVIEARCLSVMRNMAALKDRIGPVAPDWSNELKPPPAFKTAMAHIFLGGKINGAAGIMPGIFEEALHAFENHKPVFVIRAGYGAAGLLAGWLSAKTLAKRPAELTVKYHLGDPAFAEIDKRMRQLRKSPGWNPDIFLTPEEGFERLWTQIQRASSEGLGTLTNNGLSDGDNRTLLESANYSEICQLVWKGISTLAAP
jgi:hypothetical protein